MGRAFCSLSHPSRIAQRPVPEGGVFRPPPVYCFTTDAFNSMKSFGMIPQKYPSYGLGSYIPSCAWQRSSRSSGWIPLFNPQPWPHRQSVISNGWLKRFEKRLYNALSTEIMRRVVRMFWRHSCSTLLLSYSFAVMLKLASGFS